MNHEKNFKAPFLVAIKRGGTKIFFKKGSVAVQGSHSQGEHTQWQRKETLSRFLLSLKSVSSNQEYCNYFKISNSFAPFKSL